MCDDGRDAGDHETGGDWTRVNKAVLRAFAAPWVCQLPCSHWWLCGLPAQSTRLDPHPHACSTSQDTPCELKNASHCEAGSLARKTEGNMAGQGWLAGWLCVGCIDLPPPLHTCTHAHVRTETKNIHTPCFCCQGARPLWTGCCHGCLLVCVVCFAAPCTDQAGHYTGRPAAATAGGWDSLHGAAVAAHHVWGFNQVDSSDHKRSQSSQALANCGKTEGANMKVQEQDSRQHLPQTAPAHRTVRVFP